MAWKCRWHLKLYLFRILIELTQRLANVSPTSCWECLEIWQEESWGKMPTGTALQWRHNGHDSVSNHQPHDCLLSRLFRRRSKKTPKPRVTGLCTGNSPGTGEFPAPMASNAENVSIGWRHHGLKRGNQNIISWKIVTKCLRQICNRLSWK